MTVEQIICLVGLLLFGGWLLTTSLGRKALADSPPRRNNMPFYLPFIPLITWVGTAWAAASITDSFLSGLSAWQSAFLDNLILCICAVAAMVVTVFLARRTFARRLKGFGLNIKTTPKDFSTAVLNLLSVWPLVTLTVLATLLFGRLVCGQNFQLQQHQELEMVEAHSQTAVRVLIFVTAVLIVPVFEEMLFRGLFQTMLRSFLQRPWMSILISSGLFTMVHSYAGHWPALFVLSICMGYAYEKSGSLFRPIFIHLLFNAISIMATLYSA